MATTDTHDYSTVLNTNHTNISSSGHCSPNRRSPADVALPLQDTYFNYAQDSYSALGDLTCESTLEFRVPLLPAASSLSDFQSNAPPSQPPIYGLPWAHWYETVAGAIRDKGVLAQTPVYATVSIPLPGPVPAAATGSLSVTGLPEPTVCTDTTAGLSDALVFSPVQRGAEVIMKVESPVLSLHDLCHVESSSYGLDSLAVPPPIVAQNSPDLLNPGTPCPKNDNQYSEYNPADYVLPTWNSASSIPSLSYGSYSGSEGNLISASSSCKKMSLSEILRCSASPPLGSWCGKQEPASPPLVGLYADVNMRELALQSKTPDICVNPADVMTDSLMMSSPTMDSSPVLEPKQTPPNPIPRLATAAERSTTPPPRLTSSPPPDYRADFPKEALVDEDFPDEAISAIVSILKTSTVKSEAQATPIIPPEDVRPMQTYLKENQDLPGPPYPPARSMLLNTGFGDPKAPGPSTQPHKRMPLADLPIPQAEYTGSPHTLCYPYDTYEQAMSYTFAPPPSLPQVQARPLAPVQAPAPGPPLSPILNAHAGITLEELRRRANDYRARHEGADLDKSFLQCFAGRLSARGEMLDEYRCYVSGCEQRNKRRDHILVHVGAHVEHRPWMCRHW